MGVMVIVMVQKENLAIFEGNRKGAKSPSLTFTFKLTLTNSHVMAAIHY